MNARGASTKTFASTPNAAAQVQPVGFRVEQCLARYLSPITARSTLNLACKRLGVAPSALNVLEREAVMSAFEGAMSLYLSTAEMRLALTCLRRVLDSHTEPEQDPEPLDILVKCEGDAALARANALRIASAILVKPDALKVSTVTSELTRNILQYARNGRIEVRLLRPPRVGVAVVASDEGPGIANVEEILAGRYRSPTGLGLGLVGSKRLMDEFSIVTAPTRGTLVTAVKYR